MEEYIHSPFELEPSWQKVLVDELKKPYIAHLAAFVARERASGVPVYPPKGLEFNALWKTPYDKTKVVIVGQDPYHGPGQAHGLSFSVSKGVATPPSLQNIYKEIEEDLGLPPPSHGCLVRWAEQGVLMLNATLTVRHKEPLSHAGQGWEKFTDAIIEKVTEKEDLVVFVLWGRQAKDKCSRIPGLQGNTHHVILSSPHPSPFAARHGFFGSRHFSKINEILEREGKAPIDWQLA